MTEGKGLYHKYNVMKQDGTLEPDCFVLKPITDKAARVALVAYALATDDKELSNQLMEWIDKIEGR